MTSCLPCEYNNAFLYKILPCTSAILMFTFCFLSSSILNFIVSLKGLEDNNDIFVCRLAISFSVAVDAFRFAELAVETPASAIFSQIDVHEEVENLTLT